jgi:peptide methionine sulfoxide reductase MsrB
VIAISPNKSKIGVMKGAFTEDKVSTFLNDLISGGVSLDDLKGKPVFKKADKWDGKDAAPLEVSLINN